MLSERVRGRGGVWAHPAFRRLWVGHTASQVGSQVSEIALPLVALLHLHASPSGVGLLKAAEYVPFVAFALVAGAMADRADPRRLMIGADLGRALLLLCAVVGISAGGMGIGGLAAIAFGIGTLTVIFDVSQVTIVPAVVRRDELPAANSALEASRAGATIAGPGLGGALVSALTASGALVANIATYIVSAACLLGRSLVRESGATTPARRAGEPATGSRTGLKETFSHPLLRPIALFMTASNGALGAYAPVVLTFQVRELHLSALTIGLVAAVGNVGFLAGAVASSRLARRVGIGRCLCAGGVITGAGMLLGGAAPESLQPAALVVGTALTGGGGALFSIQSVALRQVVTPPALLGRVNGAMRFAAWGMVPVGAAGAGFLAAGIGSRLTLALAGGIALVAALRLCASPVFRVRSTSEFGEPA